MTRLLTALGVLAAAAAAGCSGGASRDTSASTGTGAAREQSATLDSIASPAGAGAAEPNLAVGPGGEILLSWLEPADSGYALKLATYANDRWSAASVVRAGDDFFVNWADFPSVIALPGGRLAAHWLQRSGKSSYAYGVRVAQSNDGGRTWSAPVRPHRDSAAVEHGFVAMWPQGDGFGLVWLDGRKSAGGHGGPGGHGETMLMASSVAPDGSLAAEQTVDTRTCDCCQNAVAMTSTGPIVAYRNRTANEIRDIHVTRLVDGRWTEGTPVHSDNWKINACPVNGPAIRASGTNVAVAWFTGARDTNKVSVAFSTDGGLSFGAPVRVDAGQPGGRVDLALLDDGAAIVSWLERTGGDTAAVQARRVSRDGALGPIRTITTSSANRASGFPRMALAGSDLYFAWTVATRPSVVRVARAGVRYFE